MFLQEIRRIGGSGDFHRRRMRPGDLEQEVRRSGALETGEEEVRRLRCQTDA
jgi:hypothetical protein